MLTPLLKPSLLTSMNFSAGPWNQVAFIHPSGCQTVLKRSQSPASRHKTQFSTVSRIASFSAINASITYLRTRDVIAFHPVCKARWERIRSSRKGQRAMRRTGLPYQKKIGFFLFFASISLFCIYHLVTDGAYLSQ